MINVIDQDKCIGCGTCFKSCSLDVFRLDTDQSKVSPCMAACPAGTDIRGYNALVQQGKLEEAAQKLRQANPFPGITGRICFHPCEKECARNAVDGAVNINAVEQFLGDLDLPEEQPAVRETVDKDRLPGEGVLLSPRNERAVTDAPGFGERRQGLDLHAVLAEGMRCMTCGAKARIAYNDDCMTCFTCELRCPAEAINVHPFKEPLPRTLEIHCED